MDEGSKEIHPVEVRKIELPRSELLEFGAFVEAITPAVEKIGEHITRAAKDQSDAMRHAADQQLIAHKATLDAEDKKHERQTKAQLELEKTRLEIVGRNSLIQNAVVAVVSCGLGGLGIYLIQSGNSERGYLVVALGVTLLTSMWSREKK